MTQLELKLANSNSVSCRTTQSTILVVFSDSTCRGFLLQCVDDEATLRMHASVLRMILICCNHVLNLTGDFRGPLGGPFRGPLVPSQTRCFEGPPGLSRGPGPLEQPVIRPLHIRTIAYMLSRIKTAEITFVKTQCTGNGKILISEPSRSP